MEQSHTNNNFSL